ncbi:ABC transporter ATP-binding protein [Schlesneria paludicola]|uniref:ABC transporter ATP-binding protein n=1 Tax=Schlesneria paludicola TaxID=360056 RepID=UPI000A049AB5|nr:ABC transporter ATP-binding protein [Schlesneria paludicola]
MATAHSFTRSPLERGWTMDLRKPIVNRSKLMSEPVPDRTDSTTSLVDVRHLRKSYGQHLAVKDVSFSLESGEVLGLLGPNGAGKSTTMMMVAGLLSPTSGEILFHGQPFNGRNHDQRRLLGVVPQEYAIYQELNAIENLMFFGKLYGLRGKALKARCDEVLDQIGLVESAHRPSGNYSGGMKRRLNFGVAIMHRPRILILDEPTVGVDPQSRSHLMDCVRLQAKDGVGIIYASHYMEEVQSICERVAIVDHGEVLANDSIPNLLSGLVADLYLYVDRTTGVANELGDWGRLGTGSDGAPAVILQGELNPTDNLGLPVSMDRGQLTSLARDARPSPSLAWRLQVALHKLGNLGIRVLRIETQQSNLERLFLQLTGNRLRD